MAVFDTHLAKDRVIFTLPLNQTLEALVPLAVELLRMPENCRLQVRLVVEDGSLVITMGKSV